MHRPPLYRNATQTVFGEGPEQARVMFVGEQPRDSEDLAGHPLVGPAGKLLDRCMKAAGIDLSRAYVTNAVKHFKWVPRGTRRIHSKPSSMEIAACFPWLEAEIATVKPKVVVALGATAAQALFGKTFRVTKERGRLVPSRFTRYALATVHPRTGAPARRGDPPPRDRAVYRRPEEDRRGVARRVIRRRGRQACGSSLSSLRGGPVVQLVRTRRS